MTLTPVKIEYVEVSTIERGARLMLGLSGIVEHQIEQQSKDQWRVVLPNAQLVDLLPDLSQVALLQRIDVSRAGDDVVLELLLQEAATPQSYLLQRRSGPVLVIDLVSRTTETVKATAAAPTTKQNPPVVTTKSSRPPTPMTKTTPVLSVAERDQRQVTQALALHQQGQTEVAIAELRSFAEQQPKAWRAQETLVSLLLARQAYDDAQTLLEQALAEDAPRLGMLKLQARLWLEQARVVDAMALLDQHKHRAGNDAEYAGLLAALYQREGRHSDAAALYGKLAGQQPNVPSGGSAVAYPKNPWDKRWRR